MAEMKKQEATERTHILFLAELSNENSALASIAAERAVVMSAKMGFGSSERRIGIVSDSPARDTLDSRGLQVNLEP